MASTVVLIALLLILFFASLTLQSHGVKWGLRWARIAEITAWKGILYLLLFVGVTFAVLIAAVIAVVVPLTVLGIEVAEPYLTILGFAVAFIVPTLLIAKIWRASVWRAFQAVIPVTAANVLMMLFTTFVFRPFVYESFMAPTNSMAPTLLGHHSTGSCPRCGAPTYGTLPDARFPMPPNGLLMMCSRELKTCKVTDISESAGQPDRFMVSKFLSPQRWDVVAFRLPSDPSVYYVKRLVGMPGEELHIREGAIWIDGKKLDVPEALRGIEYLDSMQWNGVDHRVAGASPVKLGPDEYFMLGDFSAQASDSRLWETGAPGHPPYAVPAANMVGVVTHIFWPIGRWRVLR
jgi:signal peptidase I